MEKTQRVMFIDKKQIVFDNNINGMFIEYYISGEIYKMTPFENGKRHGLLKQFFISGKPKYIEMWNNNFLEGICIHWFSEDKIWILCSFKKSESFGVKIYFNF